MAELMQLDNATRDANFLQPVRFSVRYNIFFPTHPSYLLFISLPGLGGIAVGFA